MCGALKLHQELGEKKKGPGYWLLCGARWDHASHGGGGGINTPSDRAYTERKFIGEGRGEEGVE